MPSWIGPWEVLGSPGSILVAVFFLISLQTALSRCSSQNRTLSPGLVWLSIVPVFGLAWLFVVVLAEGKSLGAELQARGVAAPRRPTQSLGLAMAVVLAADAVFLLVSVGLFYFRMDAAAVTRNLALELQRFTAALGVLLGLAGLVLLIIYWVSIHKYSSRLIAPLSWGGVPTGSPGASGRYCWNCGGWAGSGRFCPDCGASQNADASAPAAREQADTSR